MVPTILSSASCMCNSGYESFLVHALSLQKSMQKRRVLFFFCTNTTALHHGDWLGCIAPMSSMSLSEVHTSSKSSGGMHLNCPLKGSLLLMRISCSIALMQPSSFPSSMKMSWKAKTSSLTAAAFLGVQLLRPSKFSFSRSFSYCAATIIGSHAVSAPRAASISGDNSTGCTGEADTTRATYTPFFRKMGLSDIFLTTMDTLLLLIFSQVYACKTCRPGGKGCTPSG